MDNKEVSPYEYFNTIKDKRKHVDDEVLIKFYNNALSLLAKAEKTGQTSAIRRLIYNIDCIEKERELVKAGINSFVYESDITDYIENVAGKAVKIIELSNFNREIPDEIVDIIERVGGLFDKIYVVFTDYTGRDERRIAAERREQDPIIFGTFQDPDKRVIMERFYYLGDWVDDYCDLTLDKMVSEMDKAGKTGIVHPVITPKHIEELRAQVNATVEQNGTMRIVEANRKVSKFSKIKTLFNRKVVKK